MIKNLILLFTIIFSVTFINGQNGNIKGKVINKKGKGIVNANITIEKTNKGTMTNSSGDYTIENIKPGVYTLKITFIGYGSQAISINIESDKTTNIPDVVLSEDQEELDEVMLEGHKNKYVAREPSQSLRLKTELLKQPQNIQVISKDLLLDQQATSIMDGVIRNVSGVTMLEHWGNFARINMRGFRLPTFRNGFNMSDIWGPLSDDMAFVDRIEFVKGPAGFMLSAGEPGGFYNVVTKKPTANSVASISLTAGSFDFYRAALDLGGKVTKDGKLLYRFNAMYQTSDTHRGGEDAERFGFAPALTYNFSEKTSLTTELNIHRAESYIGSAYVFAPVEGGFGHLDRDFKNTDTNYPATDIDEFSWFTNFKHDFSDNWGFETQFAYYRYDQVGNSTWVYDPDGNGALSSVNDNGDIYRYVNIWDALSLGKFFQTYLYGKFNTGSISHNILGGFDFTDREYYPDFFTGFSPIDFIGSPFNIYNPVYGETSDPVFDRSQSLKARSGFEPYDGFTNRSVYLQDEIGFVDNKVRLTLAGRYTNLSAIGKTENDTKFTPRAGLSVDITPTITAYALYDQSFSPTFGFSFDDESFDPEEATDIEGGAKATFLEDKVKVTLSAYRIVKKGLLAADPTLSDPDDPDSEPLFPDASIQLEDPVVSEGIEFDIQGQVTPELNVVLNYANTKVIDEETGNRLAGHAKHVTNGWFNYNFAQESVLKGFGASLGYQYQIERSSWAWGADNQTDLPDYFRLDGALSWHNNKFKIQANINNILDEYLYSGANYGSYLYWQSEPGINGRITLSYNF
ncbi:TonB-dependent receptor [Flavivirga aquimarina]|uniref:TonB-dependent receptor n=1 Tax=Flavivirga aquimarina TaxID=2027862 RepID=A0ABT8WCK5_9FLAO|nr:TonB-dependent receptor [Flavivirga aquimarina]MDO5970888.1 TonB-dependent receptor [Flavivirga aquimarina]